ncbi:MAG: hypothetical protein ACM3IK_08975 [Sphingomonadaceae bacterium]
MSGGFIFWRERLMVAGAQPPREALLRLRALIEGRRFSLGQRLAGSIRGSDAVPVIRLWRRGPLSAAGDVVEFRGTLRAAGAGSAFEGSLAYAIGTKLQFVGLLVIGAILLLAGAVRELEGAPRDESTLVLGMIVAGAAALWIYASSHTRADQIRFIEEHLRSCVEAGA